MRSAARIYCLIGAMAWFGLDAVLVLGMLIAYVRGQAIPSALPVVTVIVWILGVRFYWWAGGFQRLRRPPTGNAN
jgi:hypothetical protein